MKKFKILYITNSVLKNSLKNVFDKENFDIKYISFESYIASDLDNMDLVFLDKPQEKFIEILRQKYNYPETKFVVAIDCMYKTIDILNKYADEIILENKNILPVLVNKGLNYKLLNNLSK